MIDDPGHLIPDRLRAGKIRTILYPLYFLLFMPPLLSIINISIELSQLQILKNTL